MTVTIGVKALNEQRHIAAALCSALDATASIGGDVVFADSGSSDDTVEIARQLPVTVVQLADHGERSCGAGAQLAFQASSSTFFCLIDGDMTLTPGFLPAALAYLADHPEVAGVGGNVVERNLETEEFQIRAAAMLAEEHRRPGLVDRLDGGGVYRVAAIRDVGWFADRNLHSFEEFDLAARLASRGWLLARIDVPAIEHNGHGGSGYRLLLRRLTSGQLSGAGEVLRAAIGERHLAIVVRRLDHLRTAAAIVAWWFVVGAALAIAPLAGVLLVAVPIAFLTYRRRSFALGVFSFCLWNATALGILIGLVRRRVPPTRPLAAVVFSPRVPLAS